MERAGVVLGSCWMDLTLEHVGVVPSSTSPAHLQHLVSTPPSRSCWSVLARRQHHSNTTPTPHQHGSESHSVLLTRRHDLARPKSSEDPLRSPRQRKKEGKGKRGKKGAAAEVTSGLLSAEAERRMEENGGLQAAGLIRGVGQGMDGGADVHEEWD